MVVPITKNKIVPTEGASQVEFIEEALWEKLLSFRKKNVVALLSIDNQ